MSTVNGSKQPAQERWRPTGKQIIAAVVAVAALVFIFQNRDTGHFEFLFFDFEGPVWLWMLVIFGAGIGTGLLIASRRYQRAQA
jgi:uncharacterized integral membrane protein